MLIFLFEPLQFLAGFLFVLLLATFGCRGFAQGVLRLADHQELGIGVLDEFWLKRDPTEILELLAYPTDRQNGRSTRVSRNRSTYDSGYSGCLGSWANEGLGYLGFFDWRIQLPRSRRPKFSWISPSSEGIVST